MKVNGLESQWINNILALYNDSRKQIEDFSEYMRKANETEDIEADPWQALEDKYPGIVCYAGDVGSIKYITDTFRQDFPVSKLFEENVDMEELAAWRPKMKNYPSGFEDYIQADRARIPKGKNAVMIHPDVKARMENDPEYAKEILSKVDTFIQKEILIEEELIPGSTVGMNQFIAIDAEGKIACNISVSHGSGSYEEPWQSNVTPSLIWKIKDLYKDTNVKLDIMSYFSNSQTGQPMADQSYDYQVNNPETLWEIWKKSQILK